MSLVRQVANLLDISEYRVFKNAYLSWSKTGWAPAFTKYIKYDVVPYWVQDYCRKELDGN